MLIFPPLPNRPEYIQPCLARFHLTHRGYVRPDLNVELSQLGLNLRREQVKPDSILSRQSQPQCPHLFGLLARQVLPYHQRRTPAATSRRQGSLLERQHVIDHVVNCLVAGSRLARGAERQSSDRRLIGPDRHALASIRRVAVRSSPPRAGKYDPPEDDRHPERHRQIEVLAMAESRQRAPHGHDNRSAGNERAAQRTPP